MDVWIPETEVPQNLMYTIEPLVRNGLYPSADLFIGICQQ